MALDETMPPAFDRLGSRMKKNERVTAPRGDGGMSGRCVRRISRGEGPTARIWHEGQPGRCTWKCHGIRHFERGQQLSGCCGVVHIGKAPFAQAARFLVVAERSGVHAGFKRCFPFFTCQCLPQMPGFVQRHADGRVEEHGQQQKSKEALKLEGAKLHGEGEESYCCETMTRT